MTIRENDASAYRAWRKPTGVLYAKMASPKISIAFSPPVFKRIAKEAGRRGVSFATIVRELVGDGE